MPQAWSADLEGTLLELLQDPDLFTVTHALMALGNATRTADHATRVREMGEQTGTPPESRFEKKHSAGPALKAT